MRQYLHTLPSPVAQYKLKLPKQGSINHLQEEMARLSGLEKSKVCTFLQCVWLVAWLQAVCGVLDTPSVALRPASRGSGKRSVKNIKSMS